MIIIHCTSSLTIFGFGYAIPVTHTPDIIYQILMRHAVLTRTCIYICIYYVLFIYYNITL